MLYDFHKWQNDKKPGSLHATYLVYGTAREADAHDGDVEMSDSQHSEAELPHAPFSDAVPTHTLSLVKEEELSGVYNGQYTKTVAVLTETTRRHTALRRSHIDSRLQSRTTSSQGSTATRRRSQRRSQADYSRGLPELWKGLRHATEPQRPEERASRRCAKGRPISCAGTKAANQTGSASKDYGQRGAKGFSLSIRERGPYHSGVEKDHAQARGVIGRHQSDVCKTSC